MHKLINSSRLLNLTECFNGLASNAYEYSRLMVNYSFYFIKNIMSYKLVCMLNNEDYTTGFIADSVAEYKERMDIISAQINFRIDKADDMGCGDGDGCRCG